METYVKLATMIVKNMEESVKFYSEVIGLKIDSKDDLDLRGRITLMRGSGDAMVELIESSSYPVGFWSVGIAVDDMDEAMAKYKIKGAKILGEALPITGGSCSFIEDTNGVRIAIVCKNEWKKMEYEAKSIDLELMKRTADEFLIISSNNKTFISNAVDAAFACEIYLKLILYCKFNDYKNQHDLRKLYDEAVSQEALDEQAFLKIFANEISDRSDTQNAKSSLDIMLDGVKDGCKDDFILYPHKNLSVEWRYIFEGKIPYEGVMDENLYYFAKALKKYVETMLPESKKK